MNDTDNLRTGPLSLVVVPRGEITRRPEEFMTVAMR